MGFIGPGIVELRYMLSAVYKFFPPTSIFFLDYSIV